MHATIDNSSQSNTEIAQLVAGWTVVVAAVLLLIFNPLVALPTLFVGACILGPYYSGRITSKEQDLPSLTRREQDTIAAYSDSRLEKAQLYKELFRDEIISEEEYKDVVARLFPELERVLTTQRKD